MAHPTTADAQQPSPAFGLGLRDCLVDELLALDDRSVVEVLEVMIDDALDPWHRRRSSWARLQESWPLIAHGTQLGIAEAGGPDPTYVDKLAQALEQVGTFWYSEHLAFVRSGELELGHFVPLLDDQGSRDAVVANIAGLQAKLPCSLLFENPADVLGLGGSGRERGRLFAEVLERSSTAALLDLTNLVLDARNDQFSIAEFLDCLDWHTIVEIHLAGGKLIDGVWIDSHDQGVDDEALELLEEVAGRAPNLRAIIIERDDRIPPLAELLRELERARERVARARR